MNTLEGAFAIVCLGFLIIAIVATVGQILWRKVFDRRCRPRPFDYRPSRFQATDTRNFTNETWRKTR